MQTHTHTHILNININDKNQIFCIVYRVCVCVYGACSYHCKLHQSIADTMMMIMTTERIDRPNEPNNFFFPLFIGQ